MKGLSQFVFFCLLVVATAVRASHEIPISLDQMQRLGISLAPVEKAASLVTDQLPAQVVIPPPQVRVVSAPLGGLVTGIYVSVGDEVAAGDALVLIESPAVIALQREFLQATTEKQLAAAQLKRDRQLFKEGIVAERRFVETRSVYERAAATLEERRQAMKLAGMEDPAIDVLERERTLTSSLTLRAVVGGVALKSFVAVGQRVEQADALLRLAQLDPLWLEIQVPLQRLEGVQPGAVVELPCADVQAHVNLIGRDVDPASQTVLVRAEVHAAEDCLRPGQYIQARLQLGNEGGLYRVPASAVVHVKQQSVVFVRAPFGFEAEKVTVLGQDDGYAIVRGKLDDGQSVAVSGLAAIKGTWMGLGGDAE